MHWSAGARELAEIVQLTPRAVALGGTGGQLPIGGPLAGHLPPPATGSLQKRSVE
jgi:hypothetical protein